MDELTGDLSDIPCPHEDHHAVFERMVRKIRKNLFFAYDRNMLMDATRGLLPIKKAILSAMCGQDLEDADGNTFLRQLIYAQGCSAPDIVQLPGSEATYGRLSIMFGVSWDWDLTT